MFKDLKKTSLLFLATILSFSAFAQQELNPILLLKGMQKAVKTTSYEIAFVKITPTYTESLRYRHLLAGNKTYAQLEPLDGKPQKIVQRGNLISYYQANFPPFAIKSQYIVDHLPQIMRADVDILKKIL